LDSHSRSRVIINHHRPNSRMTMLANNRFKFLFELIKKWPKLIRFETAQNQSVEFRY
jgi:hypothetical protein